MKFLSTHGPKTTRLGLVLLLFSPVFLSAQDPEWSWKTETVDTSGNFASLATDAQGNVHLAYFADQQGVKYAFRPATQSKWYSMLVKQTGTAITGIGLDHDGNPHICYTNGSMNYYRFDGKTWSGQEIAPNSGTHSYECSVAVANDGTPHVTWYHELTPTGSLYGHFKYAALQNGAWLARTVDFDQQTGKWNSLVLDGRGDPHISYTAWNNGALKYAYWDGKQWNIRTVASAEADPQTGSVHGLGPSLVLTADGTAHISYFVGVQGITGHTLVMYAQQTASGKWNIQKVDSTRSLGSWQGMRTSLALDRNGFPHISYEDVGALKHAYWNGKQWQVQVIAPGGVDPYRNAAITASPDDTLFISYRDPDDGSMKVAVGTLVSAQKLVKK